MAGRALLLCVVCALLYAPGAPAGPPEARSTIVGGHAAAIGNWPSIAFVLAGWDQNSDGVLESFAQCTGSVIAPQWVISAAHCGFQPTGPPIQAMVTLTGVADLKDQAAEAIAVDRRVVYPGWDPQTLTGDALLIHLRSPSSQPALPVATPGGAYRELVNVPNAAGWGALDVNGAIATDQLQEAYLKLRDDAACQAFMSAPASQICAGTPDMAGACVGDSGGPLIVFDEATGAPVLWGLTSYGPQVGLSLPVCSLAAPAVFSWMPAFAAWISQTIAPGPRTVQPPRDTVAPVLSHVRLAKSRIHAGRRTTLSLHLSEAAAVTVTVLRKKGARVKAILTVPFGAPAGTVKRGFAARLGSKPLKRGRYALRVAAVDTAGNRAEPVSVAFSVVRSR